MFRRKILSLSSLPLLESKTIFSWKIISEKKYCYGFMPSKNHWSPASTETPVLTTKNKKIYSSPLWRKVNRLIIFFKKLE